MNQQMSDAEYIKVLESELRGVVYVMTQLSIELGPFHSTVRTPLEIINRLASILKAKQDKDEIERILNAEGEG